MGKGLGKGRGSAPYDAFRDYDAKQLTKDEAEAKRLGISVDHLRGARAHEMDPDEYALFAGGAIAAQAVAFEAEAVRRREAREQAQHERLVELAKAKLGS